VVFIRVKPSNVINTSRAMESTASAYSEWGARVRAISVEGMPPGEDTYAESTLSSVAATITKQGTILGGKSAALDRRIEALIRSEASGGLQFAANGLKLTGYYSDVELWLRKSGYAGKTITLAARLDLYAEFLESGSGAAGGAAGRAAWQATISETRKLRTGFSIKYEKLYARAVMLALQHGGDGRVRVEYVRAWMERVAAEAEVRARVPKLPKVPQWLRAGSKLPAVGAAFDGVIGYQQSYGEHWYDRALSGVNNAAGNLVLDAGTGGAYSLVDLGLTVTDHTALTEGRAPSAFIQLEADAQVLARMNRRQALAYQLAGIKAGHHGSYATELYGHMSEEEYVEMRLRGARRFDR
jgi:hypothetical protein